MAYPREAAHYLIGPLANSAYHGLSQAQRDLRGICYDLNSAIVSRFQGLPLPITREQRESTGDFLAQLLYKQFDLNKSEEVNPDTGIEAVNLSENLQGLRSGRKVKLTFWPGSKTQNKLQLDPTLRFRTTGEPNLDLSITCTPSSGNQSDAIRLYIGTQNQNPQRLLYMERARFIAAGYELVKYLSAPKKEMGKPNAEEIGFNWDSYPSLLAELPILDRYNMPPIARLARQLWRALPTAMELDKRSAPSLNALKLEVVRLLAERQATRFERGRVWDSNKQEREKLTLTGFRQSSVQRIEITNTPYLEFDRSIQVPKLEVAIFTPGELSGFFLTHSVTNPFLQQMTYHPNYKYYPQGIPIIESPFSRTDAAFKKLMSLFASE